MGEASGEGKTMVCMVRERDGVRHCCVKTKICVVVELTAKGCAAVIAGSLTDHVTFKTSWERPC
jgi:hypothetical protein